MADLIWLKGFQFFDSSGDPLNAGKITTYDAGTTDLRTVYKDSGELTPWTNPIVLDSAGRLTASVYVPSGEWKFVLANSADVTIITEDEITGASAAVSATFARPQEPVLSKAASYTVTTDDIGSYLIVDATGGAATITLPDAALVASGQGLRVRNVGTANLVTLDGNGSQTINGQTTQILAPGDFALLRSDGSNWSATQTYLGATLSKTGAYTVTILDRGATIKADATGGAFTVTLPAASTVGAGFEVGVVKIDSTALAVTLDGNSTETISGATTIALNAQWQSVRLRCDGSNWQIVTDANRARGQHTVNLMAAGMIARTTNGPGPYTAEKATNDVMVSGYAFDQSTEEAIQLAIPMPKSWDEGTVVFKFYWTTAATAGTGDVIWGVRGRAVSNDDAIDGSWGTAVTVTDTFLADGDLHVTSETSAMTIGGTPASEDMVWFEVYRDADAGGDTYNQDAVLIAAMLHYTTNDMTDD